MLHNTLLPTVKHALPRYIKLYSFAKTRSATLGSMYPSNPITRHAMASCITFELVRLFRRHVLAQNVCTLWTAVSSKFYTQYFLSVEYQARHAQNYKLSPLRNVSSGLQNK